MEIIGSGQSGKIYEDSIVKIKVRQGRKFVTQEVHGFELDKKLERGDIIRFWATNDNGNSEEYKYVVQ